MWVRCWEQNLGPAEEQQILLTLTSVLFGGRMGKYISNANVLSRDLAEESVEFSSGSYVELCTSLSTTRPQPTCLFICVFPSFELDSSEIWEPFRKLSNLTGVTGMKSQIC